MLDATQANYRDYAAALPYDDLLTPSEREIEELMGPRGSEAEIADWAVPFLNDHHRYKCAYGGRGSGKTRHVAMIVVLKMAMAERRVYVCREHAKSLHDSAQRALQICIVALGLSDRFVVYEDKIVCDNGSLCTFHALEGTDATRESIRGWEDADITWIEEANRMSEATAKILIPTLFRVDGAELFVTFNPKNRTDWVWQRFVVDARPGDLTRKINFYDNPFLPDGTREELEHDRVNSPNTFPHVWLGEPDDGDASTKIIAYALLQDCFNAHELGLHVSALAYTAVRDGGLDIADGGADRNCYVARHGPVISYVEEWPSERAGYLAPTAHRVIDRNSEHSHELWRLYYDNTGVGSPIRGEFARLSPPFQVTGEGFGDRVKAPERPFEKHRTNQQAFARRNAQLAWSLRLRAMNTVRLLKGETVDPSLCLFIDSEWPSAEREAYMAQLSQPIWRNTPATWQIEIDKRGEENEKSPDAFDATILAFARDSEYGLVNNVAWS